MNRNIIFYCFLFIFNTLIFSQGNNSNQIYFIVKASLWQNMEIDNFIYKWEIIGERNYQMNGTNNQYLSRYYNYMQTIYSLEYKETINDIFIFEIMEIISDKEYNERVLLSKGNTEIEEWIECGIIINDDGLYQGMILCIARYISFEEYIFKLFESRRNE